jgi:hypothetical protein
MAAVQRILPPLPDSHPNHLFALTMIHVRLFDVLATRFERTDTGE